MDGVPLVCVCVCLGEGASVGARQLQRGAPAPPHAARPLWVRTVLQQQLRALHCSQPCRKSHRASPYSPLFSFFFFFLKRPFLHWLVDRRLRTARTRAWPGDPEVLFLD